ncbi:MAG: right-handed parallel beta-helix repeat-containing protein, partial [Methanosarcinales archaeon]|nr:right-handed parallel beta-helix repeat-containing protein [Methanosarcinales archaeon]
AVIENCIFDGLTHREGIKLTRSGAVFKNNIVRNMEGFTNAVHVTASDVQIIGNTLTGLSGSGSAARIICLENATNALVEGNTITNNAGEAIRLWRVDTKNVVITKNTISGNTLKGIYIYNAGENNAVYLNDIFNNAGSNVASFGTLPETFSFNSPNNLELSYNGKFWTGKPGNYWGDDYDGADINENGIGSVQKSILGKYADLHPLTNSFSVYGIEDGEPDEPEEPVTPKPQPDKSGNSISMTTNILPSISVTFSIDSLDFGDLAAGQTSAPKEMVITNSGGGDVKITAEVTSTSDDLYKRGLWIDNLFWQDFEKVVVQGETEISEVVLKVPVDYSSTGNIGGTLIMWVEVC